MPAAGVEAAAHDARRIAGATIHGQRAMKTYSAKPAEVEKKWVMIDANGLVVGRLASHRRDAAARQAQADLHAACR